MLVGMHSDRSRRFRQYLPLLKTIAVVTLFAVALRALQDTLAQYSLREIAAYLHALPNSEILLAIALTVFGYLVMTGYDTLAFHHVRHPFPYKKIALASFIGYAFNNSLGMSGLVGGSLRYRLYNAWRLTTGEIARVIAFCTISFWLGFVLLGGFIFLFDPPAAPALLHIPFGSMRILGAALLVPAIAYLIGVVIRREPVKVRDWEFKLPSPRIFIAQAAISMLDWTVAAGVLYILLPDALPMTFPQFLGVFLLAQIAGVVSNVPGGVGVFEAVILIFLSPHFPASAILGSLVAFRAIYYLFPLAVATLLLAMHEALERRQGVARVARIFGRWAPGIAPHALALMTFLTGAVLLLSGATPAIPSRLKWLHHVVPLHIIEISHFLGSIAGACLLVLARGLQQRLLRAWEMTVAVLTAGIFLQLLKGGDFEEAAILALMLFALVSTRHRFYRRSSIAGERLGLRWIGAVAIVLVSFTWLGFFSYKHVGYSNDLWWQFEFRADAPRFLRAAVGVMAVLLIAATRRLLRPGATDAQRPTPEQIAQAEAIVRIDPSSESNLALVGDKAFLFSDSGRAFIMYGVEGRSWIARGDPVGSDVEKGELIRKFRELSDLHGGFPAFYEVQRKNLQLYVDHGLSLLKIGEEARVPLEDFSLDGGSRKWMRKVQRRLETDGCTFEIMPADEVAASLDELRAISESWLQDKRTREKGFSLGFFDETYISRCPVAMVRKNGRPVAFANLWTSGSREEVSVDLMRYLSDAPDGVMDYIFLNLMLWGRDQGFRWFNLGMAPLSGLEDRSLSRLWTRIGAFAYRTGENFYNFQGLRNYKDKFDPVWEPTYLATPGGLVVPRVLTSLAALIAGGIRGVIKK